MEIQEKIQEAKKLFESDEKGEEIYFSKVPVEWFDELEKAKVLDIREEVLGGGKDGFFHEWIAGRYYILKISQVSAEKVFNLLLRQDTKNLINPVVMATFVEVITVLVEYVSVDSLLEKIIKENWLSRTPHIPKISFEIQGLIASLLELKKFDTLSAFLPYVFQFTIPRGFIEDKTKTYYKPEPVIDTYDYQENLQSLIEFSYDSEQEVLKVLSALVKVLSQYWNVRFEIENKGELAYEDYSFISIPRIDLQSDRLMSDLGRDIVSSIAQIVAKNNDKLNDSIIEILHLREQRVFDRLLLYSLSKIKIKNIDKGFDLLVRTALDNRNLYEWRLLIPQIFPQLSPDQRKCLLDMLFNGFSEENIDKGLQMKKSRIEPIKDFFNDSEKARFSEVLTNSSRYYEPEESSTTMMSGPNSPYTKETLERMSIEEMVKLFVESEDLYFKERWEDTLTSPEGIARIFTGLVKSNPNRYLESISLFDPKILLPTYISSLLRGLSESQLTELDIESLLIYLNDLVSLLSTNKCYLPKKKGDHDFGSQEDTLIEVLRLLRDLFRLKEKLIPSNSSLILEMLQLIVDKALEESEDFVEKNGRDYVSNGINSVLGLYLHAVFHYVFWLKDIKEIQVTPNDVIELITRINEKKQNSGTTKSVEGEYFKYFIKEKVFYEQLKSFLFVDDKNLRYASYEGYLLHSLTKDTYQDMRNEYLKTIEDIIAGEIPDRNYAINIQEHSVYHMVQGYVHDLDIKNSNKLWNELKKTQLYDLIAKGIDFIGRAYIFRDKPKVEKAPEEVFDKIVDFWDTMVKEPISNAEVYSNFGWWVNPAFFTDEEWLLTIFDKSLDLSDGKATPDFKVLEALVLMSESYPALVSSCLYKMVKNRSPKNTYFFRDNEVSLILEKIEKSNNKIANTNALKIRENLISAGLMRYIKK